MPKDKSTGKKLADMLYGNPERAAFGVFPQMKPKRSKQDPEAAKNFPVDLARGVVAGALGIPGDIESLARLPYELYTGNDSPTILPTSEDVLKRIPFGSDTPASQFAAGLGTLAGGSANIGAIPRAVKAAPGALKAGVRNLSAPRTLNPQAGVIKMKGGNFLTGSVEGALKPLKRGEAATPEEVAKSRAYLDNARATWSPENQRQVDRMEREFELLRANDALNNWVDRNLGNYVKKEMATPEDPVRRLAEEGITHMPQGEIDFANQFMPEQLAVKRMMAGFDPGDAGVSNAAKGWERITDEMLNVGTAGQHTRPLTPTEIRQGYKSTVDDNPWLTKLDPSTPVYYPENMDSMSRDLGFDHILDVLREDVTSGRIRPEQLSKVSMEQAVRRTAEYDQELAAKMNAERAAKREGLPVYKEYPEGYRWVELNRPGAFASESEAMGHSVRGYEPPQGHPDWVAGSGDRGSLRYGHGGWEGIKSGKAKVYSLVGPKGEPHVTVEVGRPELKFGMTAGDIDPYRERLRQQFPDLNEEKLYYMAVDEFTKDQTASLPPRITQIKGKQNAAPNPEYLPYVQDFVKSGQWSDVGDLQNTGLMPIDRVPEKARYEAAGMTLPKYVTPQERDELLNEYNRLTVGPPDWDFMTKEYGFPPPEEGMARGGRVHISDNPDVMALELQAGGLVKGLKAAAKAAKAAEAPMKASEALGRIEGRPLVITQADRTKVGGGYLGGPGFSGLQLEDPAYRAAEAAWGVKTPGVAKMILGGGKTAGKDPVYAAMLGTPTQHQSNQMVFDKLYGDFKKSAKKGSLDSELRDRINMRLANTVDKEGNPIFPPDVDILGKNFKDLANTFDRRAVTANLIGGMGVGGKKGQIIDYDKIIRETTDPLLIDSPTGALGNRLFTLSGGIIERPDLHPAFPTILQGEDLGVSFDPVARELIMKDFMERTMREKGRAPGYMDYTRGYPPSQLITEDLLTELQKMGKKAGGEVKAPAAQIDGNKFVLAAQKYGLGDDMTTLNKMVSLVNRGATVDEAARVVAGGVRKAAGGGITADDLILEERKL